MNQGDLVTLSAVKAWVAPLSAASTNPDPMLRRLIGSASQAVRDFCNRDSFDYQEVVEVLNGTGNPSIMLRNWPVVEILSVDLGNGIVLDTAATGSPPRNGFRIGGAPTAQQLVNLVGYCFPAGRSNVTISYMAGFRTVDEAQTVAEQPDGAYTTEVNRPWLSDLGVTLDGDAMTKVTGTPAAGEYAVRDGVYTFNAAQSAADVLISYSYCPPPVQQAVIELVGERYKAMTRIGEVSHSLGGSANITVSYSQKDMNDTIKSFLRNYVNRVPVG